MTLSNQLLNYARLGPVGPHATLATHPVPPRNHTPRKRFGQHFLTDTAVIDAIVAAIAPQGDDLMVEIGPGLGALTRPVSQKLRHLHAVEIDRDVIARLRKSFPPEKLTIHQGDALAFDFGALGASGAPNRSPESPGGSGSQPHSPKTIGGSGSPSDCPAQPRRSLRVIGNLPYNISTPLLFHLATFADQIIDGHFMLQKEVVARMVATPGGKEYGRLSVALQYRFVMESVLDVPPDAFEPPPKVDSAVVRMIPKPRSERTARDENVFAELVTQAFSQRRKTLRNTLKGRVSDAQFAAAGIDPGARAEEVDLARFVALANLVA